MLIYFVYLMYSECQGAICGEGIVYPRFFVMCIHVSKKSFGRAVTFLVFDFVSPLRLEVYDLKFF